MNAQTQVNTGISDIEMVILYSTVEIYLAEPQFSVSLNRWTHVGMTKDNNTVRGFIDGKKVWQATDSSSTDITTLVIGGGYGSEFWDGYISNARFVNGSTVYTHDFTPSTSPLTNITNTFFLGCQSPTERQDNFVRMFKSSTLYTTKADILAAAQRDWTMVRE